MRYILTEDRIIDLTEIAGYCQIVDGYNEKGEKAFEYLDLNSKGMFKIIKDADTIEELCDELLLFANKKTRAIVFANPQNENDVDYLEEMAIKYADSVIFGAIYTEKGLIFVAKMNEKGDLELL